MKRINLGQKVRKAREKANLSREVVAVRAGIGTNTLFRIENNIGKPNVTTLKCLADVLNIPIEELRG